jgi:hypothetical protein
MSASEQLCLKKRENSRNCKAELAFMEQFGKNRLIIYQLCLQKNLVMFKDMSKTLKMVRTDTWFDSSNESFKLEVAPNNILVQGMLISIHNYKIIVLSLTLVRCLPT